MPKTIDPTFAETSYEAFLRGDDEDAQMDAEDERLDRERALAKQRPPRDLPAIPLIRD